MRIFAYLFEKRKQKLSLGIEAQSPMT